jgi:hypothetical protein
MQPRREWQKSEPNEEQRKPSESIMHTIPSKEEMIKAVRKNGCPRLNGLPFEYMSQNELYMMLLEKKCPCLQALMIKKNQSSSYQSPSSK